MIWLKAWNNEKSGRIFSLVCSRNKGRNRQKVSEISLPTELIFPASEHLNLLTGVHVQAL